MSNDSVIRTEHLSRIYRIGNREVRAVQDITMEIPTGIFLGIEGSSGSGKSTLLNLIGCIDRPTGGKVIFDGEDVSRKSDSALGRLRLENIGFIFQQFYLIPTLKAVENIILPMKERGIGRSQRRERAMKLLEMVDLGGRALHYPNQLSGGEQQRVAIARAFANEPKVILADEPTGELDSRTSERIGDLLSALNRDRGITIIVVTHDKDVASRASRRIKLKDGRLFTP